MRIVLNGSGEYTLKDIQYNRQAWLHALRVETATKYTQAHNFLHTDMGFCCLGVACDLVEGGMWVEEDIDEEDHKNRPTYPKKKNVFVHVGDRLGSTAIIDSKIRNALGMTSQEMEILTEANDAMHMTFRQIAFMIEHLWDKRSV